MNNNKWFYVFNRDDGNDFSMLECEISENPTHDELDAIAQELLSDYGYAATDLCDCEEFFSGVSNSDIADLDRRIEQALKEWEEEHSVMSRYYTIFDTECYYYHGNKLNTGKMEDK